MSASSLVDQNEGSYTTFVQDVKSGRAKNVEIHQNEATPTGTVVYEIGEKSYFFYVSDVNDIRNMLLMYPDVSWSMTNIENRMGPADILMIVLYAGALVFMALMLSRSQQGSGGNKMIDFGKSRAAVVTDSQVRFDDIAGLDEEKEEMISAFQSQRENTAIGDSVRQAAEPEAVCFPADAADLLCGGACFLRDGDDDQHHRHPQRAKRHADSAADARARDTEN